MLHGDSSQYLLLCMLVGVLLPVRGVWCADKPAAADAVLRYVYYWYNFMPLARGSAAVGYTTILSLFWALGMPVSVNIPKDYQPDWEAILCQACAPPTLCHLDVNCATCTRALRAAKFIILCVPCRIRTSL